MMLGQSRTACRDYMQNGRKQIEDRVGALPIQILELKIVLGQ